MSAEIYPATKALSVYNMLSLARVDLTVADLTSRLREAHDSRVDEAYVAEGVAFLVANAFAQELGGGLVAPARPRAPDGKAWPLKRGATDRELEWA